MGGVGGKAALRLEGRAEPRQQLVDRARNGGDLARQVVRGHRRQVGRATTGHRVAQPAKRTKPEPDRKQDRRHGERDHQQERQGKRHAHLARHLGAVIERFGDGDGDRLLQRRVEIEAMRCRLAEPDAVEGRKHLRIGGMGRQQGAPLRIAHDVGEELLMRA